MDTRLLAQQLKLPGGGSVEGPLTSTFGAAPKLGTILSRAIPLIFGFAGFALLLMVISAGFTLMTSAGDPKKMESGKQRLTNGIVGFLIIFVAMWVVQLAGIIFNIPEFKAFGG